MIERVLVEQDRRYPKKFRAYFPTDLVEVERDNFQFMMGCVQSDLQNRKVAGEPATVSEILMHLEMLRDDLDGSVNSTLEHTEVVKFAQLHKGVRETYSVEMKNGEEMVCLGFKFRKADIAILFKLKFC